MSLYILDYIIMLFMRELVMFHLNPFVEFRSTYGGVFQPIVGLNIHIF